MIASASPSTSRPDGSSATGFRTVGGKRPARVPLSSVSSTFRQRSASQGRNVSRIHFDFARCSSGVVTSPQQSIGPPGTPSKTMISHSPVVVSAGKTKYSPTVGIRLKQTAEKSGRGVMPVTYVSASARIGCSYGERDALRVGALVLPVVQAEVALVLERGVEHELARHHLAAADVLRRSVRDHGDVVAVLHEAVRELHARLAGTHDQELAHARP